MTALQLQSAMGLLALALLAWALGGCRQAALPSRWGAVGSMR